MVRIDRHVWIWIYRTSYRISWQIIDPFEITNKTKMTDVLTTINFLYLKSQSSINVEERCFIIHYLIILCKNTDKKYQCLLNFNHSWLNFPRLFSNSPLQTNQPWLGQTKHLVQPSKLTPYSIKMPRPKLICNSIINMSLSHVQTINFMILVSPLLKHFVFNQSRINYV